MRLFLPLFFVYLLPFNTIFINGFLSFFFLCFGLTDFFDGYLAKLEDLNNEYNRLTNELIQTGPNEQTVNALIDNLKFRLNLLYRLKDKLNELNNSENNYEELQS